jgi:hypothetical protein
MQSNLTTLLQQLPMTQQRWGTPTLLTVKTNQLSLWTMSTRGWLTPRARM